MGVYFNPIEDKEVFLNREGLEVPKADWEKIPTDSLPIVLIYNPQFTAAAIPLSKQEYIRYLDTTNDSRPRKIFIIQKSKVAPFTKVPL